MDLRVIFIRPNVQLQTKTAYFVHVLTGATDVAGNPLPAEFLSAFTTGIKPADTSPPTVVAVSPVDGATDIPVTLDTIQIDFSEDMDGGSLLGNTFVTEGTPAGPQLSVSFGVGLRSVFIRQNVQLEPGTAYFVHVLTGATDVAGNPLAAEFLSSFTTSDAHDVPASSPWGLIVAIGAAALVIARRTRATPTVPF